jgi:hypothetical protein
LQYAWSVLVWPKPTDLTTVISFEVEHDDRLIQPKQLTWPAHLCRTILNGGGKLRRLALSFVELGVLINVLS